MIGETTSGEVIAGHADDGQVDAVAIYHRLDKPTGTAAAFEPNGTDATVEAACAGLLDEEPVRAVPT